MKTNRFHDTLLGLLVAAVVFPVYWLTLSGTVSAEDCGELAATLYTLGIVHPTGYPLFTWLGWIFAHLPLDEKVIWKLSLFGAVLCTLSAFVFYRLFLFLLSEKSVSLFPTPRPWVGGKSSRVAAAIATLIFAFSRTYWSEAVSLEVYALHLVFLSVVSLLFLKAMAGYAEQRQGANRAWALFAFVLGLSFANHMMTVLLAPAFLYLFFLISGWKKAAWVRISMAVPPFILGLTPYLYLPIRATQDPLMNWGEPNSLKALWYHLSAGQYHGQMFSSIDIAVRKTVQFSVDLPREFGYVPLIVAALGVWVLWRRSPRLLIFVGLLFVGCLVYSVNYAFDDPNFYLNAYLALSILIAFSIHEVLKSVPIRGRLFIALGCAALILFPLCLNYRAMDKSKDSAVEDYAINVLNSMDSGAVYFSNEYQRLAAPAFYLQIVDRIRPDIAVIDIVLLANPWYFDHLKAMHPWLIRNSQREVDAYLPELNNYISGKGDTLAYNERVKDLFTSILENSGKNHPLYVSSGINIDAAPGYRRVPSGMVFRLVNESDSVNFAAKDFFFKPLPLPKDNPEVPQIRNEYAEGYANQGAYLVGMGDTAAGVALLRKALEVNPDFPAVVELLTEYGAL